MLDYNCFLDLLTGIKLWQLLQQKQLPLKGLLFDCAERYQKEIRRSRTYMERNGHVYDWLNRIPGILGYRFSDFLHHRSDYSSIKCNLVCSRQFGCFYFSVLLEVPFWMQLLFFLLSSLLLLFITRPLQKRLSAGRYHAASVTDVIGRTGTVTEQINNDSAKGRVK